jgi:hypothetical protein
MRLLGGLEAMETVSVMPVSLKAVLKGFKGKILRKSMHLMMLKGTLDTVGIDWEKTMDKDTTWEMEDYRKMASMAQFIELPEELPLGTLHEEQNKRAMKNWIFLKNRQNSKKLQHWLKPGSLNCKKTC